MNQGTDAVLAKLEAVGQASGKKVSMADLIVLGHYQIIKNQIISKSLELQFSTTFLGKNTIFTTIIFCGLYGVT